MPRRHDPSGDLPTDDEEEEAAMAVDFDARDSSDEEGHGGPSVQQPRPAAESGAAGEGSGYGRPTAEVGTEAAGAAPVPGEQQQKQPGTDATNLNISQAILKGLDIVKQRRRASDGGDLSEGTGEGTERATANTPPSSVCSTTGSSVVGVAVESGVDRAMGETNEAPGGTVGATSVGGAERQRQGRACPDADGSRRMIPAALGSDRETSGAAASAAAAAATTATTGSRGYANVPTSKQRGGPGPAIPPTPAELGVYVPPYKRRQMEEERKRALEELAESEEKKQEEKKQEDHGGEEREEEEEGEERDNGGRGGDTSRRHHRQLEPTQINIAAQRQSWEDLRKLINGTINRLNATTIKPLIHKLFSDGNLIRGRGLLARTVLRAATTSPSYADVYAALIAVINTKLPEVGELVLTRTILQFQRSYKRRDKAQAVATANFMGQLFNQGMTHELLCLQLLTVLLDGDPTDDSVEVAVSYMRTVGKALAEVSPAGVRAVMERFRGLLHDGTIGKRVQYKVEGLMKDRRNNFEDYPTIVPELDLVEQDDQIMFELGLDDEGLKKEEVLDVFRFDPDFEENERTWAKIRGEILGEDSGSSSGSDSGDSDTDSDSGSGSEGEDSGGEEDQELAPPVASNDKKKTQVIHDLTESDLVHLRRTIYLTIMSSATFEECTHKLTKVDIPLGRESELINMIIECCSQERTFLRYYGMIAGRFCLLHPRWCDAFLEAFGVQYETIHRLETNKLRNVAKLFAHLLHTDSMPWSCLSSIHLNEDETTSSSRIFVKILVQEMAEAMGMSALRDRFETDDPEQRLWYAGMFPRDVPRNTRYAINFFTSIGLGPLTDGLREHLKNAPKLILAQAQAEAAAKAAAEKADDDSSVSSSSSSSTSSGSSTSSSSYSSSSSSSYSSDSRSRGRRRGRDRGRSSRKKGGRSRRRRSRSSSYSSYSSSSTSSSSSSSTSSSSSSSSRGKKRGSRRRRSSRSSSDSRSRGGGGVRKGGDRRRRSRSLSSSRSRSRTTRRKDDASRSRSRSRSPRKNSRSRSPKGRDRSRSPSPRKDSTSHSPNGRDRNRSYTRSRSPPRRKGGRSRSYSSSRSRSPIERLRTEKRGQSDRDRSRSSSGRDSRDDREKNAKRRRYSRSRSHSR